MIYIIIFALIAYAFYYINKVEKDSFRKLGEESIARWSINLGGNRSLYDHPFLRKLIGINEKYSEKEFFELPKSEKAKIGEFARSKGLDFYQRFLFFYDKSLVYSSSAGKGGFLDIPSIGDDLYYAFLNSKEGEIDEHEVAFVIKKRLMEGVIPGQKILVYTGYLKDKSMDFDHKIPKSERINILFNFPVTLTLPMPHWNSKNYQAEDSARKELAKKFDLEYQEGELDIEGFEDDLGNWSHPSTPGRYKGKYFEFYV